MGASEYIGSVGIKAAKNLTMKVFVYLLVSLLLGCTSSYPYVPETHQLDRANLPIPEVNVSIPNLSSCTDADDKSLHIDPNSPLTVLVHGCNGSAGRFRSLAQLYAFHGQQAICYSYDDRRSLIDSADSLSVAVAQLSDMTNNQKISIVGHSMGGLIGRKAVEENPISPNLLQDKNLELITISAPLSGIQAANHCGSTPLHWLSLGIVPSICWMITGDNWYEITSSSSFIQQPNLLIPSIQNYLKIVTDERNTCRRKSSAGECLESDYVFDLAEQYHPKIDSYANVTGVQVEAGHVEIIGNKDVVPRKLLSILQEHGMLALTPPEQEHAFEQLLADLY